MRLKVGRRLACCTRDKGISIDFDEHQQPTNRIITYDGLESCIINSNSYVDESETGREDRRGTESLEDEASSCSSTSAFMSFISNWVKDDSWEGQETPNHLNSLERPPYVIELLSDVNTMKETFSKLLLGEDVTGGAKGVSPALALSNAIANLAASVFGELWKLEPLPEESKSKWHTEMDWFLSPAKHMVELVPAKQGGNNGQIIEIMTPKAREDVHMNLPALQKLDCMLIDTLDSMGKTEFWYSEGSSHHNRKDAKGGEGSERQSKRWWLPYPRVPTRGLSEHARKKLISQGNVVQQVFKASKAINQNILCEMPVPKGVKDALPKCGRRSLGEEMYNMLVDESISVIDMADSFNLNSEHQALEAINKLESAQLVWREYVSEYGRSEKTQVRKSWFFRKDSSSNVDKIEFLLYRAENILRELRLRFPHLPHTFLDMTKIQYHKDVAHLTTEAYSRVLSNLAYKILLRIGDILQEDHTSNPTSPMPMTSCFPGMLLNSPKWTVVPESPSPNQIRARRSLVDQMSRADSHSYFSDSNPSRRSSDLDVTSSETRSSSVTATPNGTRIWCKGGDGTCSSATPCSSP